MTEPALFGTVGIIGFGLIGSSLARVLRAQGIATRILCVDRDAAVCATVLALGLADRADGDAASAAAECDLVIICTPIGAYGAVAAAIGPALRPAAIVTDVGSVKQAAVAAIAPHLKPGQPFVPGHPIAGTEKSGPEAGFAELFAGRWCILTPPPDADPAAVAKIEALWLRIGSRVAIMPADHHDRVLAITSHLPHLIAYTIVGTATDLEEHIQSQVIEFSASGFRDFTRIAASDPVMWRDIFLNNREAVLEMLGRLSEDLAVLQRAIRMGDGKTLEDKFTRTRAIRRGIVAANQA